MLDPWERDTFVVPDLALFRQRLFDIAADDVVTYNAQATVHWQADQDARRAAVTRNGHEVVMR